MHYTIFDTPVLHPLMRGISRMLLRLCGWRFEGRFPDLPKYVLVGAPHTSNWDFPLTLGFCFAQGARFYWMGKTSLFKGWRGPLMRWLGGIPVDRSRSTSLVQATIDAYAARDELAIAIAPEGTRSHVGEWKTGFYHIAHGAGVPIVLAWLDYPSRRGGIGPVFVPTGNADADIATIKAFYADKTGKVRKTR